MPIIPPTVLKKLYVEGSLRLKDGGFAFDLKNLIAPATITGVGGLEVDGEKVDDSQVAIVPPSGNPRPVGRVSSGRPLDFPVGVVVTLHVSDEALEPGKHDLTLHVDVKEIGSLEIPVSDHIA
jgi:hypothetical protein